MMIEQEPSEPRPTDGCGSSSEPDFNPPILAIAYLQSLGYEVNDVGVVNERIGLKILEVKREDDGTPADFAFASNMQCTAGVVLPYPIQHYIGWIDEMEGVDSDGEELYK